MTKRTAFAVLALVLVGRLVITAQSGDSRKYEAGLPFLKYYSPQEYGGHQQVWSFAQDDRGVLYAGHSTGLLEYDGTSWRAIATPHNTIVRTLARGPGGRIFVGEVGDFGYLQPDEKGEMHFRSLLEFIPPADRDFQDVRRIYSAPEGVYVQTFERLFLLTPQDGRWNVKVWKPATRFNNSFYVFGNLYVTLNGMGLQKLVGEALVAVPAAGLEQSVSTSVRAMLAYSAADATARQILLITRNGDFRLLDDRGLHAFPAEESAWRKLGISSAALLGDGSIGAGTTTGGFVIVEHDGKTRRYLDRTAGITSDGVLAVFSDRNHTVWLGLQNGIAKVDAVSPFSEYGRSTGISAAVNDIVRYHGVLHLSTTAGIKFLDAKAGEFRPIQGAGQGAGQNMETWGLLVHGDSLLAAGSRAGIFQVTGNSVKPAIPAKPGVAYYSLAKSRSDPNRVWLGTDEGLGAMRWNGTSWVDEGVIAKTPVIRSIVEPEPGLLWLGTQAQGVIRIKFRNDGLSNLDQKRFGKQDGLPADGGVFVTEGAGRVVFASPKGVREFDAKTARFVPSEIFGAVPTSGAAEEFTVAPDQQGNIWANFGVRPVLLTRAKDDRYDVDRNRVRRIGDGVVIALAVDDDNAVWFGGLERLERYDPRKAREAAPPAALIRKVTAGNKQTNILYIGGALMGEPESPVIAFQDNTARFEYALPSFDDSARNQYQTKLDGFDNDWSAWGTDTRRDYTNLPPGRFRFRVKARNLREQEGAEAQYSLQVLPPWYQRWWAFVLYALLFGACLYAGARVVRARVQALEREKSVLRETQLRAETAAAEAKTLQAENERNKNVELLSEIGKDLTSTLDLDTIFFKLYEHVNQLMDASVFGVGIYHPQRQEIEYRLAVENGKRLAPYTRDTKDHNQFAVWCIDHRKPVFLNDANDENDSKQYLETYDSSLQHAASLVYLPLMMKDQVLGVITVQSFSKNAYTNYHLDLLENLASYTSIALDNADSYEQLKSTQEQLLVQEKLASLGALTAGIAHEIKNPLNFVNNFADLSVDLMEELQEEVDKLKSGAQPDVENMTALLRDLSGNAKKINEHGKRADGIVKSMLMHSRGAAGEWQVIDINNLVDEYVNLSYHGTRAQDSSFNATIERGYAATAGKIDAIPQDLSRVFLNLLNNAFYAVHERTRKGVPGYKPTVSARTVDLSDAVEVRIRDNGTGIPPEVKDKIFNPFFTTKPTGQGTGLGLSISHDIVVQEHGGQLEVHTAAGEFTEFVVRLPRRGKQKG